MITVGQLIRTYRKKAGLTATQLAEKVDVTQGTISQLETDRRKPTPELFSKIVKVLQIPKEEKMNIKTPIDDFLDKPIKSTSFIMTIGVADVQCTISTKMSKDINFEELSEEEKEQVIASLDYFSPIYINAVTKVLINNQKQINEQIGIELRNKIEISNTKIENPQENED